MKWLRNSYKKSSKDQAQNKADLEPTAFLITKIYFSED